MKPKLATVKAWLRVNYKDILRILTVVAVGCVVWVALTIMANEADQDRKQTLLAANQNQILRDLEAQAKQRDRNVQKLIQDNAQQTLILCTIILGDSTTLTPEDKANIEAICNRQIEDITNDLDAAALPESSPSTGDTSEQIVPSQEQSRSSSSQSAPNAPAPQPNTSQPDNEGVIIDLPILPKINIPSPF